eukprot:2378561-Lingulodinium_polyedra.AAC.1
MAASRPGVGGMLTNVQPTHADWAVLHFPGLHLDVCRLRRSLLQGRCAREERLDAIRLSRRLEDAFLRASI